MSKVTLQQIADRIKAHLARIEADAELNKSSDGKTLLYKAFASTSGTRMFCTYKSFQGSSSITKAEALRYLDKLDAGFVGRHWEALREDMPVGDEEVT